jgi:hypothetical protein
VDAGSDRTVGAAVTLSDMTFQDPGSLDVHTATIDWGDGTALDTGPTIDARRGGGTVTGTHTYAASGTYTLTLCVTDQHDDATCDTRRLEVRADPFAPEIEIEAGTVASGSTATLGALFSDRNVDDTHTVSVDWGDGASGAANHVRSGVGCVDVDDDPNLVVPECTFWGAVGATHSYTASGSYLVVVEVCDQTDRCDTDSTTLVVAVTDPGPGPVDPPVDPPADPVDPPVTKVPFIVSLTPARLLDTRDGAATFDGAFAGGGPRPARSTIELDVTNRGGVPATGVDAVVLNVAAIAPDGWGFVTIYPCGTVPNASAINHLTTDIANEVIAKVSPRGTVCIDTYTTTHLLTDVVGYIPTGSDYRSLTPARLLDTRDGAATFDGAFAGGGPRPARSTIELDVTNRGGVPATGVDAVVLNVAAIAPDGWGFVTIYPCGTVPNASAINHLTTDIANEVIAKVSPRGTVCIDTYTTTHLLTDVVGYIPTP